MAQVTSGIADKMVCFMLSASLVLFGNLVTPEERRAEKEFTRQEELRGGGEDRKTKMTAALKMNAGNMGETYFFAA